MPPVAASPLTSGLCCLLAVALGGCVAQIKEERVYGSTRLAPEAQPEVIRETHEATSTEGVSSVSQSTECRDVLVTPTVRDVQIHRSFANDAQLRNMALVALLAAGIGLLSYGTNHAACPHGTCLDWSDVDTAQFVMVGAAAIPVGFLAYNAIRVQNSRAVDYGTPRLVPGPWGPCAPPLRDPE